MYIYLQKSNNFKNRKNFLFDPSPLMIILALTVVKGWNAGRLSPLLYGSCSADLENRIKRLLCNKGGFFSPFRNSSFPSFQPCLLLFLWYRLSLETRSQLQSPIFSSHPHSSPAPLQSSNTPPFLSLQHEFPSSFNPFTFRCSSISSSFWNL